MQSLPFQPTEYRVTVYTASAREVIADTRFNDLIEARAAFDRDVERMIDDRYSCVLLTRTNETTAMGIVYGTTLAAKSTGEYRVVIHEAYYRELQAVRERAERAAMRPAKLTMTEAKGIVGALGFTLTKRNGDYRLAPRDGTPQQKEDRAYYTSDLDDVVSTAQADWRRA